MFTCGPGSLRCEGGTSDLPLGRFDLPGLVPEPDGSIRLQVFAQGYVSRVDSRYPQQDQPTSDRNDGQPAVVESGPSPQADVIVHSILKTSDGRYSLRGRAVDHSGAPACALVLASGRCAFSCGPGSLRCEGGTASLPFGEFELRDLPLEPDGSIRTQVFVEEHVSYADTRFAGPGQLASWGVANNVCCASGGGVFAATIGGVTKRSELASCSGAEKPSWDGYARITSGNRQATGRYTSPCGNLDYPLNVTFNPGSCYLVLHDSGRQPFVQVRETSCAVPSF
jgi:hypothetical protein